MPTIQDEAGAEIEDEAGRRIEDEAGTSVTKAGEVTPSGGYARMIDMGRLTAGVL